MSQEMSETRRHEWTEDEATFTVEEVPNSTMPKLIGEHFHDTWGSTGNEAVLAREVLFLASELKRSDEECLKYIDRISSLEVCIEQVLDLLIHETEESRRVEQAYRMLEKMMMDGAKG